VIGHVSPQLAPRASSGGPACQEHLLEAGAHFTPPKAPSRGSYLEKTRRYRLAFVSDKYKLETQVNKLRRFLPEEEDAVRTPDRRSQRSRLARCLRQDFFLAGHSPDWCHTRFGPEAVRRGASFPLDDAAKTGRSPGKTSACAFPHCLLFHFFTCLINLDAEERSLNGTSLCGPL
jgi:hypothetical protein